MKNRKNMIKILGMCSVLSGFTGCASSDYIRTIGDQAVEYGTAVSTDIAHYLAGYDEKSMKYYDKVISEGNLVITDSEKKILTDEKWDVGVYTVIISYRKEIEEIKVTVQDTVKPVWKTAPESINTAVNQKPDFTSLYSADDLSEVKITADDSQVDYSKAGNYRATISATDASGNTETKEVSIIVKSSLKKTETQKDNSGIETNQEKNETDNFKEKDETNPASGGKKKINFRKTTFVIPESMPQGNLNDYEYEVQKSILYELNHSEGEATLIFENRDCIDIYKVTNRMKKEIGSTVWIVPHYIENNRLKVVIHISETKEMIESEKGFYKEVWDAVNGAGVYSGMTEEEAVNRMAKWIASHMTYVLNYGDAHIGFTTGKGCCSTYTGMLKEMCDLVGIESQYIGGNAGGSHAWNRVQIDNKWYYVDVTWYDTGNKDNKYLLSEKLWSTHKQEKVVNYY